MIAEIIAVGTELLLGDIVNTNAQFLSRELAALGVNVYYQTVVGDNPARLEAAVRAAMARSDLLVFTGGLGPTDDDVTKQTVARAFGDELRYDESVEADIERFFAAGGRTTPENNKKQAYVPVRGRTLRNHNGTAPGMIFEDAKKPGRRAVLLPGPPGEMRPMFLEQVRPWLASLGEGALHSISLRVAGVGESHLEGRVAALLQGDNPTAALYAKNGEVVVRVTARAENDEKARAMCEDLAQRFCDVLGDAVYTQSEPSLEHTLVRVLRENGKTLATAESCTGGLVSQRITGVPGASEVFGCGVCTYANEAKTRFLGVPAEMLAQHGAVSPEVAAAMARGVREAAGADIGVGVTGIAGPGGGTKEKPVGLVYIAAADETAVYVHRMLMERRTRETVRDFAAQRALDMARRAALGLPQPLCQRFANGQPVHFEAFRAQDV